MKIKKFFVRGEKRAAGYQGSARYGEYALDFYYDGENPENCKIEIRCGVSMEITLNATHEAYGFLMSCWREAAADPIEAYCGFLWMCSHLLAADSYFPKRVLQSWQKYVRGIEKRAESAAAAVTDIQNRADEALMREAVRIAEMPEDERAAMAEKIIDDLKGKAAEAVADAGLETEKE